MKIYTLICLLGMSYKQQQKVGNRYFELLLLMFSSLPPPHHFRSTYLTHPL